MKLSIITINYNNLEGLKKTYDSVVCQTWTDYEWIIIDGGSTDGSREFIEEHQDRFAYWCSEPDKGVYNAMNKGIAKAKGEYLNFMNSGDCFYEKETLEKVFSQEHQADILYGDINFVGKEHNKVFHYPKDLTLHYFLYRSLGHPSTFIRTFLLKEHGYREDFRIVSDWAQFLVWFREGKTFEHLDMIVSLFDLYGISSTNSSFLKEEKERVFQELFRDEDRGWIEESIQFQKEREEHECREMEQALRLVRSGGRKRKVLRYFLNIIDWIDEHR